MPRGRSERAVGTLQDRLVEEFKLAGITDIEAASAFIREVYLAAHNARFAAPKVQPGSAFTPTPGVDLNEILCVQEERQVGNDNCISYCTLKLQIPESPARQHLVRAGQGPPLFRGPAPCFTSRANLAATIRAERSATRKAPLKSARRRNPIGGADEPPA